MGNNGLIGLFQVVYGCTRDGFGRRQAWKVTGMALCLALFPVLTVALLVGLIAYLNS